MISHLQGKIILKQDNFIVLDVNGIGFKVFLLDKTINKIPQQGQELKVFTCLIVREKSMDLYGFLNFETLQLFETLQGVSGVGPKTALMLTDFGSLEKLKADFEKGKTSVKGIGKKKMQKIVLEVTGKIKQISQAKKDVPEDEALDALIALGFPKPKAKQALSQVPADIQSSEQKIKQALKILGK